MSLCRSLLIAFIALVAAPWSQPIIAQAATGTLVFDVKPFTSKVKLKEKIENRLKTGDIEWGAADGQLVVTTVNKRFIRFDLPHVTRYGEGKTLEMQPTIESESNFLLKFFMPELPVKLVEDGAGKQEVAINNRVESSIAWNDYNGPLKFTAQ